MTIPAVIWFESNISEAVNILVAWFFGNHLVVNYNIHDCEDLFVGNSMFEHPWGMRSQGLCPLKLTDFFQNENGCLHTIESKLGYIYDLSKFHHWYLGCFCQKMFESKTQQQLSKIFIQMATCFISANLQDGLNSSLSEIKTEWLTCKHS